MYIRLLVKYGKWNPGACPDVQRSIALSLIAQGIAAPHDGQALTEAQSTAAILAAEDTDAEPEPQPPTVVVVDQAPNKFKRRKSGDNLKKPRP